jgi:hypothetical protein
VTNHHNRFVGLVYSPNEVLRLKFDTESIGVQGASRQQNGVEIVRACLVQGQIGIAFTVLSSYFIP